MKFYNTYIVLSVASLLLGSCNLIEPNDIENPNVTEKAYLEGGNAMDTWVNGLDRTLAMTVSNFCLQTEIISDNYFNNYTRESKLFDRPQLLNNDPDVNGMERGVAQLRSAADYSLKANKNKKKKVREKKKE